MPSFIERQVARGCSFFGTGPCNRGEIKWLDRRSFSAPFRLLGFVISSHLEGFWNSDWSSTFIALKFRARGVLGHFASARPHNTIIKVSPQIIGQIIPPNWGDEPDLERFACSGSGVTKPLPRMYLLSPPTEKIPLSTEMSTKILLSLYYFKDILQEISSQVASHADDYHAGQSFLEMGPNYVTRGKISLAWL